MPRTIRHLALDAEKRVGTEGVTTLTNRIKAKTARLRTLREHPTALALAQHYDPTIVRTPAMDLLDARLHECLNTESGRLIVSVPPQSGKTTLARWAILRALVEHPDYRIVLASYAASLAKTSGRIVRSLIEMYGKELGLSLDYAHRDASDWQLEGFSGGLYSCGVGGSLTGRPADVLFVDDALRGLQDADSETIRGNLHNWWESVARTRLAPGAPVGIIATRWHKDDLSGRLEEEGWPVVNIPALADGKVPDALDRPVGEWLVSTRGTTIAEWEATRKDVGERVWHALYQGAPSPPAGRWFLQEWFDRDRVAEPPPGVFPPVVYVDPADNTGGGDAAGIIVGRVTADRHIYVGPDYTLLGTTARWVRVSLLAVVKHEAAALAYERSLSGLARSVREGWAVLRKQALMLQKLHQDQGQWPVMPDEQVVALAMGELTHNDDTDATKDETFADLVELWPLVPTVLRYPMSGPNIRVIKPQGTKLFRAQSAAPALEQRRVHVIGRLPEMEFEAVTWQPGQASPNRLDTLVHMIHDLSSTSPGSLSRPSGSVPTRSTRPQGRRGVIPRSTRAR